jgi:serine protease Do
VTQLPSTEAAPEAESSSNPVPDIAESAKDSVVGVVMYNKELVSGQEPIETKLSSGTGFVISDDGYILTNNHVVAEGNLIKVTTNSGEEYVAELIGRDSNSEVAVLKVEGLNLPALPIGDSTAAKTGELVVAIGNPINDSLQNTVTVGYLSSTSRQIVLNGNEMDMLQIDAAINPGNSGGPLLNSNGEVIGINTSKKVFAGTDGYGNTISAEGIGFAIPISAAMDIANALIENGSVVRPGIGFSYSPISESDAELWQVPKGILITGVVSGSPADEAGLRPNDVITSLDNVDLTTADEVPTFDDKNVGDTIPATVWREGTEYNVTFTLGDLSTMQ